MPFWIDKCASYFYGFHEYSILALDQFVVIFIDGILIYSKSQEDHEKHLRIVL